VFLLLFDFSYVATYKSQPYLSIGVLHGTQMLETFTHDSFAHALCSMSAEFNSREHLQNEGLEDDEASEYAKMLFQMLSPDPNDRSSLEDVALLFAPSSSQ